MPSLKCLSIDGIDSINITGLVSLRSLHVIGVDTILGKESIVPLLTHFSGTAKVEDLIKLIHLQSLDDYFLYDEVSKMILYEKMNVKSLSLSCNTTSRCAWVKSPRDYLQIPPTVKSLNLAVINCDFFTSTPEQSFSDVSLSSFRGSDISMFRNTERIRLAMCEEITNIESLRNVPYLSIICCPAISSFECLGNQRFLEIYGSSGLSNSDVKKFRNISYLSIARCQNVTKFNHLSNNEILKIEECNLPAIYLNGTNFSEVRLSSCSILQSIQICGKVYSLNIIDCGKLTVLSGLENCKIVINDERKM
jgi:hypothetical protein